MESAADSSLVSVVLPTFNRAETLARAMESVLRQDHARLELIVVDDGSLDETSVVLSRFGDARLRYVALGRNRGQSAARNAGIAAAAGELVAFQDSDDEWLPGKLSAQVNALAMSAPDTGVVYSDMIRIYRDGRRELLPAPVIRRNAMFAGSGWIYGPAGLGIQSCLIRRCLLMALGGFEERLRCFEDLDLLLRLARHCEFLKLPEPLVHYYETEGVSADRERRVAARRHLLRRHGVALARQKPLAFTRELVAAYAADLLPSRR